MEVAIAVLKARHAMVSFADSRQVALAAEICQTFAIDNGAFSVWRSGGQLDIEGYIAFVRQWMNHPGFDWALIPDVIDGTESENDYLIQRIERLVSWPQAWVPIWHLHESIGRLARLVREWPRVAFGSSGEFADIGTERWWSRMSEAMEVACDKDGLPKAKLHGLRMMDPTVFSHIPFSSVDSTMVARNTGLDKAWAGPYQPLTERARGLVLVDRIEYHASANRWAGSCGIQKNLELVG